MVVLLAPQIVNVRFLVLTVFNCYATASHDLETNLDNPHFFSMVEMQKCEWKKLFHGVIYLITVV
jgi:hypothetical protein